MPFLFARQLVASLMRRHQITKWQCSNSFVQVVTAPENDVLLFGDSPLNDLSSNDCLDVSQFAQSIANSILANSGNHSLVLGIEGKWGSGKSSLTFLIQRVLENADASMRPLIVHFQPWMVRGVCQLVGALFDAILTSLNNAKAELGSKQALVKKKYGNLIQVMWDYKELAIEGVAVAADVKAPGAGAIWRTICNAVKKETVKSRRTSQNLVKLKEKIGNALIETGRSLVVFIDDIDRLDPDEAMEVMRLVRAVADFPKTIYLLNYDPEIISQAAEQVHGAKQSRSYLEKIVNVPIRVPAPDAFDLRDWFERDLAKILSDWMTERKYAFFENEADDLHAAIYSAGDLFLKTPRDVRRALDASRFALASLPVHVWIADVVWLSILKIGSADLYAWIEKYVTEMASISYSHVEATEVDKHKYSIELNRIASILDLPLVQILKFMTPYLLGLSAPLDLGEIHELNRSKAKKEKDYLFLSVHSEAVNECIKECRLSSPSHFRYFFRFQSPRGAILAEDEEKLSWASKIGGAAIIRFLIELDDERQATLPSKMELLLRHLSRTGGGTLVASQRVNLLEGLQEVLEDQKRFEAGFYGSNARGWNAAADLLSLLLPPEDNKTNRAIVSDIFKKTKKLSWANFVVRISHRTRQRGEVDNWFQDWQFGLAKTALLDRFKSISLEELLETRAPSSNLYGWLHIGGDEACKRFIAEASKADDGFIQCVQLIASQTRSLNGRSNREVTNTVLHKESLSAFFDVEDVLVRLNQISADQSNPGLAQNAKSLLEALVRGAGY